MQTMSLSVGTVELLTVKAIGLDEEGSSQLLSHSNFRVNFGSLR